MNAVLNRCDEDSPFLLENEKQYQTWRARKLKFRQEVAPTRVFKLDQQGRLPRALLQSLREQVAAYNFVIFQSVSALDKTGFLALNSQFGLTELDANPGAEADKVTSLRVVDDTDDRTRYIPYTNRAMNWHTDGYYNSSDRRIDAFALYCVSQAGRGGGNTLFDHEMMYMLIRDKSPAALAALMCDDMLHIPANIQQNRVVRAEESGPVFALQANHGALNMRYTSRPQNIVWKSDRESTDALNLVREILMEGSAEIEVRLQPGQGIVCNNILHGRQAFHDAPGHPARLVYRARYHDAIDLDTDFQAEV